MTDKTFTSKDMVGFAAGKNAAEFSAAFDHLMAQNVSDILDGARREVAQTFTHQDQEEDTDENPETTE